MKKIVFLLVLGICAGPGAAQKLITPPASPPSILRQQIGLTPTTLTYSRPSVLGRKIFGELIPFGQIWRAGANEATKIRFERPVQIADTRIQPGAYGIYAIPDPNKWTWVLSRDTALWGDRGYNPANDILRLEARIEPLTERVETLEFRWMNLTHQGADLVLEWENTRTRLPIGVFTNEQMAESIQNLQGDKITGDEYYRAARYYLDNGLDRMQALRWINKRIEKDGEQFGVLRYKALLELELGDTASATATMNRSLDLARTAGNTHYIRMNEQSLKNWAKTPAPLSAENILARSIAYHDPEGKWPTGALSLSLYESRPGGDYRLSDILIDNGNGIFELNRKQGKDVTWRRSGPDSCQVLINGEEKMFVEAMDIHVLRCKDNERYRNYYTYLWGLPMKLRDPGTVVHPTAWLKDFYGRSLYEVKVTYLEEVGRDSWYFYFDPESFALAGYRFYHDEKAGDGEYILLEGEKNVNGFIIPSKRDWYTHQGRLFLGSDEVIGH